MNLRHYAAFLVVAGSVFGPCYADGTVVLDFNQNQADYPAHLRVNSDDSFHVQVSRAADTVIDSECGLFRMSANGTLVPTFGSQGRLSTGECARDFAVRANGSLDLLDVTGLHLQFRDAAGALLSTSERIFPAGTQEGYKASARALVRLSNGQYMAGGELGTCIACDPGDLDWAVTRLNADGSVDNSFANGLLLKPSSTQLSTLVELPDGKVLGAGRRTAFEDSTSVARFDSAGLDFTYGLNATAGADLGVAKIAVDSGGRAYVAGRLGNVVRLDATGNVDATYTTPGPSNSLLINAIAVDSLDRVLVFGGTTSPSYQGYIARFTSTGARDTTFNGTGVVTFNFAQPAGNISHVTRCIGALQSQDRPLLACLVENLNGGDLGVARFTEGGLLDTTFGAIQIDTDLYPDAFSFPDVSAPYGTLDVVSATVTISGFDAGLETTVVAGAGLQYSIDCNGTWTEATGLVTAGGTLCVRQDASTTPGGARTNTITVGGRQASFTVLSTNTAADSIPDAFSFTPQTGAPLATAVMSNSITVTGITGYTTATATNGTFSIDCTGESLASAAYITNGMQLCVRHTTSAQNSTSVTTTLTIGGVAASFISTPVAAPSNPGGGGDDDGGGGGALDELLLACLGLCVALSLRNRHRRRFQTR
jgi:uncharacterized delta-60 repeat protein